MERVRKTYSDHETYFSYEINVFNGPMLYPGIHNFPFSFTLPPNIPSSFESKYGHVRYQVRGKYMIHTVPAPLKGAPYIQKLFFGPLDYHIKNT